MVRKDVLKIAYMGLSAQRNWCFIHLIMLTRSAIANASLFYININNDRFSMQIWSHNVDSATQKFGQSAENAFRLKNSFDRVINMHCLWNVN